eukprot:CAMPEP_0175026318 /NCGR_PEP_ID=MMETSP0005-20121125/17665_1 /TAXON_ID=420556 /ORGANISM="Ochromonas sp., Strain CCMP1393" /LENGTH=133 /DNA_ID=CAMNT_0016285387 /DNA_START=732 /DNA_END=1133 /DNA_ORIENTATION=-
MTLWSSLSSSTSWFSFSGSLSLLATPIVSLEEDGEVVVVAVIVVAAPFEELLPAVPDDVNESLVDMALLWPGDRFAFNISDCVRFLGDLYVLAFGLAISNKLELAASPCSASFKVAASSKIEHKAAPPSNDSH